MFLVIASLFVSLIAPLAAYAAAPQDTYSWLKNIGTPGCYTSTSRQFTYIAAKSGKLYSAEPNGTVYTMDMSGTILSQFKTTPVQTLGGLAVDSAGNIYVTNVVNGGANPLVQKYSSTGTLLFQFGSQGAGNGQFNFPVFNASISLDSGGNIYVADSGNHRIQKFDASGNYLSQFGSAGTGNGQFTWLGDIMIDPSGTIYAADHQAGANGRIQIFNSSGTYQSQFPLTGLAGTTGIVREISLARDGAGAIYVAVTSYTAGSPSTFYPTIQKYSSSGSFISQFGSVGASNGQFNVSNLSHLALDTSSNIYATDYGNYRIQKFDSNGVYQAQYTGNPADDPSQVCNPSALARDASGNLYLLDGGRSNVKIYNPDGSIKKVFGSAGLGNGQFAAPNGIAVDTAGSIYVFDGGSGRIQKFDSNGTYISQFGSTGSGNGQFSSLWTGSMVIDKNGNIYVVDNGNGRIQKFDANGNYVSQFPVTISGTSATYPLAITLDMNGDLYVTAVGQTPASAIVNEIIKYDPSGTPLGRFGSNGSGDGQFTLFMNGITIDAVGAIYVADSNANRVEKFDSNGVYLSQFGNSGSHILSSPQGIVTDASGNVYVVEGNGSGGDISVWNAPILPGAPQNVAATPASFTSLTITWQPPVNAGSSAITGYKIQYRVKGTSTWIVATTTSPSTFSYTLTGLKAGTAYNIQVVAQNALGLSTDIPLQANQGIVTTILSAGGLADTGSDAWMYLGIGGSLMLSAGILLRLRHIHLGSRR